jgi:hypothetical protein
MSHDLRQDYVALAEAMIHLSELQDSLARGTLLSLEEIRESLKIRDKILTAPDRAAALKIFPGIQAIEKSFAAQIAEQTELMTSHLAAGQTHVERLQAAVAELKKEMES